MVWLKAAYDAQTSTLTFTPMLEKNSMYLINSTIGNPQVFKTMLLKVLIPDAKLREPYQKLIDTQTALMKEWYSMFDIYQR